LITVKVHTILTLKKILGKGDVEVSVPEGSSIDDLLSLMVKNWGDRLAPHLFNPDSDGLSPRTRLTRIMVNGRDIEFLNGLETVLHYGDEILILPIMAGG